MLTRYQPNDLYITNNSSQSHKLLIYKKNLFFLLALISCLAMKEFIFNLYKVSYLVAYNQHPNSKPFFLGNILASAGVFGFFFIAFMNINVPVRFLLDVPQVTPNKPLMWGSIAIALFLTHELLFKVLGLENHNYYEAEYKPTPKTIKKIKSLYLVNFGILFISIVISLVSAYLKEMRYW